MKNFLTILTIIGVAVAALIVGMNKLKRKRVPAIGADVCC